MDMPVLNPEEVLELLKVSAVETPDDPEKYY